MGIQAVIFDLDGLLADTEHLSYALFQEMLRPYGHTISLEEYAREYSGKSEARNIPAVIAAYALPLTVEEGHAYVARAERALLENGVALKAGARALLDYLAAEGLRVGLATSSGRARAMQILESNAVAGCFHALTCAEEVGRGKPWPDIFLRAGEKLGCPPAECLVLEDSEAGVRAAHAAGMRVINIPDMRPLPPQAAALAEARLSSLAEVIPWLAAARR